MGSLFSKTPPPATPSFKLDTSTAKYDAAEVQRQLAEAQQKASTAVTSAVTSTKAAISSFYTPIVWLLGLAVLVVVCIVIYDFTAPDDWPNIFFSKRRNEIQLARNQAAQTATPPTIYQTLVGPASGNLSGDHDATKPATIPGSSAPLSGPPIQKEGFEPNTAMVVRDTELKGGAYGMQWWMFVKDWNYAFGKEKIVLQRPDATNPSILNPKITLHPTDNSLVVSVSVFPNTQGGSSKVQPAPAGHSGSSDDVFVCTVPNIPLQTWFAVGVTCFGRNLDVYIDGKLVKSCFLSGVPKPCLGDIQLTPEGGFSGYICDFKHFSKMLVPEDVNTFWSTGTSCRNKTMASTTQQATGHSVSFGIHDVTGKKIKEWSF